MHPRTLGLAAALAVLVLPAAAAQAQAVDDGGSVRIHRGGDDRDHRDHRDHRHNRNDPFNGQFAAVDGLDPRARTDVIMDWYGGEWAKYNNRSWESDSYNDWWHDQPSRSFPRWVLNNSGCRQWYSADVLRC